MSACDTCTARTSAAAGSDRGQGRPRATGPRQARPGAEPTQPGVCHARGIELALAHQSRSHQQPPGRSRSSGSAADQRHARPCD